MYQDPIYKKAVNEYFDITDNETRTILLNINEADQNQVMTALVSKLYDNIVDKVDDIDYGDIPNTKGDITKLPNYDKINDCIIVLTNILNEYKQDDAPIRTIDNALENIKVRKDMFEKAFRYNIELPMVMYSTICLSIISSVSYMISTCIEFIKSPSDDGFKVTLDKVALAKTKQNLLFVNLDKFNKSCKSGEFDKAMDHIVDTRVKNFTGINTGIAVVGTIALIGLILNIIPILRELVFFFYYSKTRVSDYFDAQADLLQMNAHNLEQNELKQPEEKERIIKKQLKIVELFRKLSNKLAIDNKESEVKATKEIVSDNKKFKTDEVLDTIPDSASSALF